MIHPNVKTGKNLSIGEFIIIDENVIIGDNVTIGNFVRICSDSIIGDNCTIGDFCKLHEGSILSEYVQFDDYANTTGPCQLGAHNRVSKRALISKNVITGEHVYFGGGVMTSYSTQIDGSDFATQNLTTNIESHCAFGSRSMIAAGVTICSGVTTGYGTLILKDIDEPGTYVGVPAKKVK